ncbi:MAG: 3-deoxy-manno-octulosonate cytidylyltransferase [Desulfobulbaceae bacterium]|nr:3-deoxy-manno-octulosonate cytidylyltransferase [Candidatus Kapabacteria bacterium]MBS3999125.1 3-deoxy-manno-octulosonate cytidylyltransferase [Desulfobulbaceae bacterium]
MKNRVVALIPARYDSKRFPGKLTAKLGEKSVIVCTYENVRNMGIFDDVIVVTNSHIIRDEIDKVSGKVIFNDSIHPSGTDRIAEVAKDLDYDIIINVQGDEPFIGKKSLEDLIAAFDSDEVYVATLAQKLESEEAISNPNNVKVILDSENMSLYFSRLPIPFARDKGTEVEHLKHIGVYAFRKEALLKFVSLSVGKLEQIEMIECLRFIENGIKLKVILTETIGIEIDTETDLQTANKYLQNK